MEMRRNMVIAMKDDAVKIYNIGEADYLKLVFDDPHKLLDKYCVQTYPKNDFSTDLLKGDARLATYYYFDNGFSMIRKDINDINEIEYYLCDGKLWPSKDYYLHKVKKAPKIVPLNRELTALDYKLDNSVHVRQLFQGEELEDFKAFYDKQKINAKVSDFLKGKSYNVNTYIKLILNPSKMGKGKLTAQKLKDCLCLIVTPIGITRSGDIKYSISEFLLETYIDKINSEFIKLKNQNNIKADEMTDNERYDFLETACKEVINNVQTEVLERTNDLVFSSNGKTWEEYSDTFLMNYAYSLTPIDLNKWKIYKETLIDSRTVHNGSIVPLVEENALNKSASKKKITSVSRMSSAELLETQKQIENDKKIEQERNYPSETYTVDKESMLNSLLKIEPSYRPKFKIDDLLKVDDTILPNDWVTEEAEVMIPSISSDSTVTTIDNVEDVKGFEDISTYEDITSKFTEEEKEFFDMAFRPSFTKSIRRK